MSKKCWLAIMSFGALMFSSCKKEQSQEQNNVNVKPNTEETEVMRNIVATIDDAALSESAPEVIEIKKGQSVCFSGEEFGSVGTSFLMEYDESAFDVKSTSVYDNPNYDDEPVCGGDSAVRIIILTAKQSGTFKVRCIKDFRGDVEGEREYTIVVE